MKRTVLPLIAAAAVATLAACGTTEAPAAGIGATTPAANDAGAALRKFVVSWLVPRGSNRSASSARTEASPNSPNSAINAPI